MPGTKSKSMLADFEGSSRDLTFHTARDRDNSNLDHKEERHGSIIVCRRRQRTANLPEGQFWVWSHITRTGTQLGIE